MICISLILGVVNMLFVFLGNLELLLSSDTDYSILLFK